MTPKNKFDDCPQGIKLEARIKYMEFRDEKQLQAFNVFLEKNEKAFIRMEALLEKVLEKCEKDDEKQNIIISEHAKKIRKLEDRWLYFSGVVVTVATVVSFILNKLF